MCDNAIVFPMVGTIVQIGLCLLFGLVGIVPLHHKLKGITFVRKINLLGHLTQANLFRYHHIRLVFLIWRSSYWYRSYFHSNGRRSDCQHVSLQRIFDYIAVSRSRFNLVDRFIWTLSVSSVLDTNLRNGAALFCGASSTRARGARIPLTRNVMPCRYLLQISRGSFLSNPLSHIWPNWKEKYQALSFSPIKTPMISNAEAQATK
jgi:hypothetical protein